VERTSPLWKDKMALGLNSDKVYSIALRADERLRCCRELAAVDPADKN